jgi:hypothetical protein
MGHSEEPARPYWIFRLLVFLSKDLSPGQWEESPFVPFIYQKAMA